MKDATPPRVVLPVRSVCVVHPGVSSIYPPRVAHPPICVTHPLTLPSAVANAAVAPPAAEQLRIAQRWRSAQAPAAPAARPRWLLGEAYACDQEEKGQEPGMSNASARLGHNASDSKFRLGLGAGLCLVRAPGQSRCDHKGEAGNYSLT